MRIKDDRPHVPATYQAIWCEPCGKSGFVKCGECGGAGDEGCFGGEVQCTWCQGVGALFFAGDEPIQYHPAEDFCDGLDLLEEWEIAGCPNDSD